MAFSDWLKRNFGQGSWIDNQLRSFDNNVLGGLVGHLKSSVPSLVGSLTGSNQTQATLDAQAHQDEREDTMYQRRVVDMQAAGINPMMAAGGSATSPQSVSPQQGAASLSDIMQLIMLGPQKDLIKAQADNLRAGAEEKRAKTPYWSQRIKESEKKIEAMSAGIEKDLATAALNKAKKMTEDELREFEKSLKQSEADLNDAYNHLANHQADEVYQRKCLEAAQEAYQKSLNENDMAQKVCAKIVAETNLAGAQASKEQQNAIAVKLANAMIKGDFVEVCREELKKSGHDNPETISQITAAMKNLLSMISVSIG